MLMEQSKVVVTVDGRTQTCEVAVLWKEATGNDVTTIFDVR